MARQRADFDNKIDALEQQIKKLNRDCEELGQTVQQRDASILDQTNTIMKRDETIVRLQAEIDRLTNLNENSGLEAGELSKQLTETQRKLQEAEAMIAKL